MRAHHERTKEIKPGFHHLWCMLERKRGRAKHNPYISGQSPFKSFNNQY